MVSTEPDIEPIKPSVRFSATMLADSAIFNTPVESMEPPDSLRASENDWFTSDGYVEPKYQSLTEKGIRLLCSELLELKKASADEMRKNVYANYTAFIRTSQELGELEMELMTMRTLISTQAVLVRDLLEGVYFQSTSNLRTATPSPECRKPEEDKELLDIEKRFHILSDSFDIFLAECKLDEALAALDGVEMIISEARREDVELSTCTYFTSAFSERKARLVAQLVEAAWQPTLHGVELRKVVSVLNQLGDGAHAHTLLLNSYHIRLQNCVKSLHPTCSWYTGTYTGTLAHLYFSTISQASRDSLKIFGNIPACASELVLWACKETEEYVSLVKKHILSFSVMTGGIGDAADCVQISLRHCALLENQGLSLSSLLLKLLKPFVEAVLDRCLTRMEEGVRAHVASDNWSLTESPVQSICRPGLSRMSSHLKLSTSAHRFNFMVQDLLEDVALMMATQFGRIVLEGISSIFNLYVKMLIKALPDVNGGEGRIHMADDTSVIMAETEAQQLAILGNAAALADELLPQSALKWHQSASNEEQRRQGPKGFSISGTRSLEQKDWLRHLQRSVDELRNRFCELHILELLFHNNVKPLLTAELYVRLNDNEKDQFWPEDPMPSPPFQVLFMKLKGLERLATDVLAGRERVVILLLMRLTEAFVMWLSKDDFFWASIEDGPQALGPFGLQQLVLDMQFVIQIASAGRHASRKMRQTVSAIISRAENAFLTTGMDPKSVLQEDQWFEDAAKGAMCKIISDIADSVEDKQKPDSPAYVSGLLSEECGS